MSNHASTHAAQAPGTLRRLLRNPFAMVALGVLSAVVLTAIFGPLFFHYDPETTTDFKFAPPSERFWFGTDLNGRDLFSRVIQGARISLLVGLSGALVSFFIGTAYGLVSGYVGGRVDNVMMRFIEALYSIPRLIIVIVAIFTFDKHLAINLNVATAYSVFGDNPRIVFAAVALLIWIFWAIASRCRGVWKSRLLFLISVVIAWRLTPTLISASNSFWTYAQWLFGAGLVALLVQCFMFLMRFENPLRTCAGVAIAIVAALFLAPDVEALLSAVPLGGLVDYSKVIILIVCLGLIEWLSMARIVRGQVLALKEQQFVLAARSLGQSHFRILTRHLLPNLAGVVIVYLTLTVPAVILDESFLSFLGLGINDPKSSWGSLLSDGKSVINPVRSYWWLLVFPAAAMSLTLLSLNFLGDAIRDAMDPRSRK